LGVILLGVFASKAWNPSGADGLLLGGTGFFFKQVVAVVICSVWAFAFTYGMLWLINLVTPAKVGPEAEERGLDIALHGEEAYPSGA
jgi:Amt family ammonium transporter